MGRTWIHDIFGAVARAIEAEGDDTADHGFDPTAYQRLGKHIADWFQHFSNNAIRHWAPQLIDVHECDYCDAEALTTCIACGTRVCLAHAHVSFRGEAICDECVTKAIQSKPKASRKKRRTRPVRMPPEVQQALVELGLDSRATWEGVQTAYRAATRLYHPDKVATGSAAQRAAASLKMSRINAAYATLKAWYSQREAA